MEKGGRSGIIGRAFVTTLIWNSIRTRVGGRERDQMEMDNGRLPAQMRGRQKAVASELQIDPTDRHRANLILGVDSSGTKARRPGCLPLASGATKDDRVLNSATKLAGSRNLDPD